VTGQPAHLGELRVPRAEFHQAVIEVADAARVERQSLDARSQEDVPLLGPKGVYPPKTWQHLKKVEDRFQKQHERMRQRAEIGIAQQAAKAGRIMQREEKLSEKALKHSMDQHHSSKGEQAVQKMEKIEGRLAEELAHQVIKAEMGIQRIAKKTEENLARKKLHMQKDVLQIEKHSRQNMIHHRPGGAPLTVNQLTQHLCFLPKVMHDMKLTVACCIHHHVHCPPVAPAPQQVLPLLKHKCLMPQATWSAMQHVECCMHFSIGCGTTSSQQSPGVQHLQPQHPAVGAGAGQPPQRGHSTTAVVTTTTTTTSMAEGVGKFVDVNAGASVVDASPTLPSTAPFLVVALAAIAVVVMALAACCFLQPKGKAFQPEEEEEDTEELLEEAGREALPNGELRRLLSDAEQADPELVVGHPSEGTSAQLRKPDPAQRAEAEQEMERVLSAKDASSIFGHRDAQQQNKAFRRLVRLLHPDKRLVSGSRANMALRLVLESHRSITANK